MDLGLVGRRCLVTGASQGIGLGTAKVLAAEGCRVALVSRRGDVLEKVAEEIRSMGGSQPLVIEQDVTAYNAAGRIRQQAEEEFGGIDILVNCAGGSRSLEWSASSEAWGPGMLLNFEALRTLTVELIPGMQEQAWGRVISVTGTSEPAFGGVGTGRQDKNVNVAPSAKAAVHAWAKGLSRILGPDGITVNCIAPGIIQTPQVEAHFPDPLQLRDFVAANIPIGEVGQPADIGHIIAFVASPRARYITGEIIHVDGGMRRFAF